ncbi:MAG: CHAT domain-containing protein [Gloeomargarita sp. SKYBB_i_bin120]|nr:CHAT domain-containing protein [Gloeomargarita sp. SKYG98]MCS7292861.1 CHAT domain-containing protein [Gloeomargarita sp. SKYB120]MDW8178424.1 CHAT domain-containing protein [Gloeomargarita sp. SKYBB_i_bin120]
MMVLTLPVLAQVTPAGSGTSVYQSGNEFNITGGTQAGRNLFHTFYQFGLHQGQTANFFSNPTISNILARVTGGSVSYINGLIQVLGGPSNLYLMNPAGIVFGPHASLNVPAAFTATTADKILFPRGAFSAYGENHYQQLVGEPIGFVFSSSKPGILVNEGNLQVKPGQSLNLVAGQVISGGTLTAPGGSVVVTSVPGERWMRLSQPGHLLSFEFDRLEAINVMVDNTIPVTRLPELIAARGPQVSTSLTVQNDTVRLHQLVVPDQAGTTIVTGKVNVASPDSTGGAVHITGNQVAVLDGVIDASGRKGGGRVLIGGNYQGQGSLPRARQTLVNQNSVIRVDAWETGPGGEAIVWSDGVTRFYGSISARGGAAGGNGGLVEVSGRERFIFQGQVDTSAPQGRPGTLLLDPRDIVIVPGNGVNDPELADGQILFSDAPDITFTIGTNLLASQLTRNNVILQASNNIVFTTSFSASGPITRLFAQAGNNIDINGSLSLEGIGLELVAGGRINARDIFASRGIKLDANRGIQAGNLTTRGRSVNISSGQRGALDVERSDISLARVPFLTTGGGDIRVGDVITSGGSISIATANGRIEAGNLDASSEVGNAGNIGVDATGTVTIGSARAESSVAKGGSIGLRSLQDNVRIVGVGSNGFSISTKGVTDNGVIGLIYSGRNPFNVGNATVNGSAGPITTGLFTLTPPQSLSAAELSINSARPESGSLVLLPLSFYGDLNTQLVATGPAVLPAGVQALPEVGFDTADFSRVRIAAALNTGDFTAILNLDSLFADEFRRFLNVPLLNNLKSVEAIADTLGRLARETGKKPAVIYFMVDEQQLTIAAVTPGNQPRTAIGLSARVLASANLGIGVAKSTQPIVRSVPEARRSRLIPLVERFVRTITDPRQRGSDTYLKDAQQLYRWLIAPIEQELQAQGIETFLLALDSGLRLLPMAALHDGKQFLVEKYSMTLIPSINLVDMRYRNLRDGQVLAMGADTFVNQVPLPAVPLELKLITQMWPGRSFLNQEFTVQRLTQERLQGGYPIVHLATHADFAPGRPENSYIEFGNNQRLSLPQLRQLPLQKPNTVELLTLSACRTSVGDLSSELGFAGLAVKAGAKSALASLWYVSDEGTLALMNEFYRYLKEVPIKAEALRRAQVALLRGQVTIQGGELRSTRGAVPVPPAIAQRGDQTLTHPYYWAGFTLVGSPW